MKLLMDGLSPHQPAITAPQPPTYLPRSLDTCRGNRSLASSWGTGAGHTDPTGPLLAAPQACEPIPEPPKRAAGNSNPACKSAPWHSAGAPSLPCRAAHTAHPSPGTGTHGLPPCQTCPLEFILTKVQAHPTAAGRGHNSREPCLAFPVRAPNGICNVTQSLSPLALHLFIYGRGQQWPKKFIKEG